MGLQTGPRGNQRSYSEGVRRSPGGRAGFPVMEEGVCAQGVERTGKLVP